MPRIIDATSIKRIVPDGRQVVSSYRTPAAGDFGADLADLITGIADRREKSSLAKAENEFLLRKAKQDNAYDEDEDYTTIESRWTQNVEEGLSEAANQISNPALREEFIARQRIRVEEGRQRMEEFSRKKEYDFERADLDRRLEDTINVGLDGDDFMTAYKSASNLIDTNIALSEQEREKLRQSTRTRLATGRLEMLPPEKRMAEIERLSDHLPKDVIAKYKRQTEAALVDERAQAAVDTVMSSDATVEERRGAIDKQFKGDTKARDEANRRLDYRLAKEEEADVEQRKELHNKYFLDVREGRRQMSDLSPKEKEAMGPEMVRSLYAAQDAFAAGKTVVSDPQVLFDLHQMKASKDPNVKRKMVDYFTKNSDKLGTKDLNSWMDDVAEAATPPEVEGYLTTQQHVIARITQAADDGYDYGKADQQRLLLAVDNWYTDYQNSNGGKIPTVDERNAKVDQLMLRFPTSGGMLGFGRGEKPLFQMSDEELGGAMQEAHKENKGVMEDAIGFVKAEGVDITTKRGQRRVLQAYKILTEE